MTNQPLRLVVDRHDQSTTDSIEVQSTVAAGIHIHLHLGGMAPIATPPAAISAANAEGRSGKGRRRPWLIAVCGLAIATGAFEFGARSGEGHARSAATIANAGIQAAELVVLIDQMIHRVAASIGQPKRLGDQPLSSIR
jgi:hypothetical protein